MKKNTIITALLVSFVFLGMGAGTLFFNSGSNVTRMVDDVKEIVKTKPISVETTIKGDDHPLSLVSVILTVSTETEKEYVEKGDFIVKNQLIKYFSGLERTEVVASDFEQKHNEQILKELNEALPFEVKEISFTERLVLENKK